MNEIDGKTSGPIPAWLADNRRAESEAQFHSRYFDDEQHAVAYLRHLASRGVQAEVFEHRDGLSWVVEYRRVTP